ncbi:MAG: DCC1-like thiol-disulfide oxidoreductase family protein [Gemmatimonadaceae bacterium]
MTPADARPILLYDDTCGMCAASVQFVLRHERGRRTLEFASLTGELGTAVRATHLELHDVDSVVWWEPRRQHDESTIFVRSAAVLHVLRYLGGAWRVLAALGSIVPRPLLDMAYDFVARHRHSFTRGGAACILPTADQRSRFRDFERETAPVLHD